MHLHLQGGGNFPNDLRTHILYAFAKVGRDDTSIVTHANGICNKKLRIQLLLVQLTLKLFLMAATYMIMYLKHP
ncbi:unnamed protein product [Litomosoides sigmodontis]|uniref:Uncharacterized protein n=1 Tax=Litomosoides sigmodontis TaxID=42156 RepID=A0A3P6TKT9_LITSI|nr:unnamed protein product [Litomosoides sigmodontis]